MTAYPECNYYLDSQARPPARIILCLLFGCRVAGFHSSELKP